MWITLFVWDSQAAMCFQGPKTPVWRQAAKSVFSMETRLATVIWRFLSNEVLQRHDREIVPYHRKKIALLTNVDLGSSACAYSSKPTWSRLQSAISRQWLCNQYFCCPASFLSVRAELRSTKYQHCHLMYHRFATRPRPESWRYLDWANRPRCRLLLLCNVSNLWRKQKTKLEITVAN